MTDAEINRHLALAIGWKAEQMEASAVCDGVILPNPDHGENYRVFDYRDPTVIWPVAERYKCFPDHCADDRGDWFAWCRRIHDFVHADTAAKAVALAVIEAQAVQRR